MLYILIIIRTLWNIIQMRKLRLKEVKQLALLGRVGWLLWQTTSETQYFNTIKYLFLTLLSDWIFGRQPSKWRFRDPGFLLFNGSSILWTQRTAENHLHLVCREERESLENLLKNSRLGRLEVAYPHHFCPHSIGQNSVTWPHPTAVESGKCSLSVCLEGQGNGFGDPGALSLPLARRRTGIPSLQLQILCSFHYTKLWDSSPWMIFDPNYKGRLRGTHHCLRPKRETEKSSKCFFNALFCFYGHIWIFDWIFQISCMSSSDIT